MHHKFDLSLILACYNETETFVDSVKQIITVLDKTDWTWEIIFIDDGSTDNTPALINKALKKYPSKKLSVSFHSRNLGRGKTVSQGFLQAQGRIVGFIDIDLEIPAWYIPRFVEAIDSKTDAAIAWRIYDLNLNGFLRWLMSKGYGLIRKALLGIKLADTEAGYKFFRRDKILPLVKICRSQRWFWDTEIVARALKKKLSLVEIPVVFIRRTDKTSSVKLFPDTVEYLTNLFRYRSQLKI